MLREDLDKVIMAERLISVREFVDAYSRTIKILISCLAFHILGFFVLDIPLYLLSLIALSLITPLIFSKNIIKTEFAINDSWEKYWYYKRKNLEVQGITPKTFEGFTILRGNKVSITVNMFVMVVIYLLTWIRVYEYIPFGDYWVYVFSILTIIVLSSIFSNLVLPNISFIKSSILKTQREVYVMTKRYVRISIFFAFLLLYLGYISKNYFDGFSFFLLLEAINIIAGFLLGLVILNWYKTLFIIRTKPIEEPPLLLIIPVIISVISVGYFSALFYSIGILDLAIRLVVTLVFSALLIPILYYQKIFMGLLEKVSSDFITLYEERSEELKPQSVVFYELGKIKRIFIAILASIIVLAIITSSFYIMGSQYVPGNKNTNIYMFSLITFIISTIFGYHISAKKIVSYCLETLNFERRKYVSAEKIVSTKKEPEPIVKPLEKDFETIINELERIFGEEEF